MKKILLVISVSTLLFSCGNSAQDKAIKDQKDANAIITSMQPGRIAAKEGEWTVTMKVDGKEWVATSLVPPDANDRIIGYYKEESVSLPYNKRNMIVGNKINFGGNYLADFYNEDEIGIWGGHKGEMEITKVENGWAEGKFSFTATATGTDKAIEITDGFFRISIAK